MMDDKMDKTVWININYKQILIYKADINEN